MDAEHIAGAPLVPAQLQFHGWPLPVTADALPALQRFAGAAAASVCPLSLPQAPTAALGT